MKNIKDIFGSLIAFTILVTAACTNVPRMAEEQHEWTVTDSTIQAAVAKEMKAYPNIEPDSIMVEVDDGIVTLYGKADNILEKEKAGELASMIRGVRSVINLVDIETKQLPDQELMHNVEYALQQDPVLKAYKIIVRVDTGIVSLHGSVNSWHETQLAEQVVKQVEGIRKVNNELAFVYEEDKPVTEVRQEIKSLLRNDVRIDDGLIDVTVRNGTAILSGKVGSAAEKSLATVSAHVPGIDTVINEDLEVSMDVRDPLMRKDKYVVKTGFQILEAIQETFMQDPRILNHDILVEVDEGDVVLSGSVTNLREKKAAEEDAMNVVGVRSVENNIKVEPVALPGGEPTVDNVRVAMEKHPLLDEYSITAETREKGIVTLKGQVDYYFEKAHAEDVAANVPGVVDIINNIEVVEGIDIPLTVTPSQPNLPVIRKPHIKSDEQIKEDVAYQLWWSPFVDRNQVEIEVEDGEVTLRGTVNTELEMEHAIKNAYEGGAFAVVNELKVEFWEF